MKLNELSAALQKISDQLNKAKDEIVAALQNVEIPAEAQTAINNLSAVSQALDDLNPDKPV